MFSRHNRVMGLFYLAADALLALASFALAYWVRGQAHGLRPLFPVSDYPGIIALVVGLWIGVGMVIGIYREIREEELRRAFLDPIKVGFVATVLLFALISALKIEYISRLLLGFYAAIDLVVMILFRLAARRMGERLRQTFAGLRYFLLVGDTPDALALAKTIEANESRGMRLFGFIQLGALAKTANGLQQQPSGPPGLRREYPVYSLAKLPELLRQQVIDEVLFAVSKDDLERLEETFLLCEEEGVKTRVLLTFFPHVISKVRLERLHEKPLLTFSTTPENEDLLLLKRAVDFFMALVFLIVLSPLLLVLAVLIKLTSRGPVLYRQTRCGLGGRKFTVYKFRSMRADADLLREELAALNEMDGPVFKIRDDPRCTPVGRFMRKFSLDELPQLVNILKGDMSFVGPRPPLPEEVEKYELWQRRRLRMQPGLTCLWALEGRNRLNFNRWMELDLEYIDHWSPSLDWKIILKTIPVVLLGRGAS
ncbi:MAG: sugar transferase [Terriglobia bacterium]|jgi:exopolysaccharide biosynthesis polyprenyl glycosylphosphotransferase